MRRGMESDFMTIFRQLDVLAPLQYNYASVEIIPFYVDRRTQSDQGSEKKEEKNQPHNLTRSLPMWCLLQANGLSLWVRLGWLPGHSLLIYHKNSITGPFCLMYHNGDIETQDRELQRSLKKLDVLSTFFTVPYPCYVQGLSGYSLFQLS